MTIIDPAAAAPPATPTVATGSGPTPVRAVPRAMARLASWRLLLGMGAVFAAFAGVFFTSSLPFAIPRVEAACGQAPPDVRFAPSGSDVQRFLDACGATGREAYRYLQVADLAYPTVFGLFVAASLALAISRVAHGHSGLLALAAVPLLAASFDYLENVCAWVALSAYPEPTWASSAFGFASAAKNVASWTAGAVLLGALVLLGLTETRRAWRSSRGAGAAGHLRAGRR